MDFSVSTFAVTTTWVPMTVVMMVQMALMMTRQWSLVILPIVA